MSCVFSLFILICKVFYNASFLMLFIYLQIFASLSFLALSVLSSIQAGPTGVSKSEYTALFAFCMCYIFLLFISQRNFF